MIKLYKGMINERVFDVVHYFTLFPVVTSAFFIYIFFKIKQ